MGLHELASMFQSPGSWIARLPLPPSAPVSILDLEGIRTATNAMITALQIDKGKYHSMQYWIQYPDPSHSYLTVGYKVFHSHHRSILCRLRTAHISPLPASPSAPEYLDLHSTLGPERQHSNHPISTTSMTREPTLSTTPLLHTGHLTGTSPDRASPIIVSQHV